MHNAALYEVRRILRKYKKTCSDVMAIVRRISTINQAYTIQW